MSIAETYTTYDTGGNREDLIDQIFDISPVDCPVSKAVGSSQAKAKKHDWQTDELAAADADNAALEGDEYNYSAPTKTQRVQNYTQIFRKTFIVSGTQEVVGKGGRTSEVGYQAAKKAKEIKRDLEAAICSNNASLAGSDSVARKLGGFRGGCHQTHLWAQAVPLVAIMRQLVLSMRPPMVHSAHLKNQC